MLDLFDPRSAFWEDSKPVALYASKSSGRKALQANRVPAPRWKSNMAGLVRPPPMTMGTSRCAREIVALLRLVNVASVSMITS
jgi:hypothetical protein